MPSVIDAGRYLALDAGTEAAVDDADPIRHRGGSSVSVSVSVSGSGVATSQSILRDSRAFSKCVYTALFLFFPCRPESHQVLMEREWE